MSTPSGCTDDSLLDRTAEELGSTTKKDTVRAALQQGAACRLIDRMAANDSGLEDEALVNSMWAADE